jgi:GNAT superfamily N-acetyltransferase
MAATIQVRAAILDDAAAITLLIQQLGYPVERDRIGAILRPLLDDPAHIVLFAEEAPRGVLGLLTLSSRPALRLQGWVGAVDELVVRAGGRGRGVGERLLRHAKGLAAERGWVRLEAQVTRLREANRRGFFLSRGFLAAETVTYRWGLLEGKYPRLPMLCDVPRDRELMRSR